MQTRRFPVRAPAPRAVPRLRPKAVAPALPNIQGIPLQAPLSPWPVSRPLLASTVRGCSDLGVSGSSIALGLAVVPLLVQVFRAKLLGSQGSPPALDIAVVAFVLRGRNPKLTAMTVNRASSGLARCRQPSKLWMQLVVRRRLSAEQKLGNSSRFVRVILAQGPY